MGLLISCKSSTEPDKTVTIALQPKSNSVVAGTALFTEKKGTVLLKVTLSGLQPGVHAIHIHEKADDFVSQPTGNAGGRVACAGIIK